MIYKNKFVIIRLHNKVDITGHLTRDYKPGQDAHLSYDGRSITIPFWMIKTIERVNTIHNPL